MLKTRIITALCMLAVLVAVLKWGGELGFTVFCGILTALAAWEWARLLGWQGNMPIYYGLIMAGILFILNTALLVFPPKMVASIFWGASTIFWLFYVPFALYQGVQARTTARSVFLAIAGCFILPACWLALIYAYEIGINYLFSTLLLVWAADVGAYFSGKAFGKNKLAPQISPGKSWEGVVGGALLVIVIAVIALQLDWLNPTFFSRLQSTYGNGFGAILLICFVGMSVVGDLFESLIKRQAEMKDSSQFLPGHGGILDRIDALLPVLPLSALLLM